MTTHSEKLLLLLLLLPAAVVKTAIFSFHAAEVWRIVSRVRYDEIR
jgi:hypothetical protein